MYFQIFVADQHRSLFQFLWWKEGSISDKPTDYEMCVQYLEVFDLEPAATTLWTWQLLRTRRNLVKKLLKLCKTTFMWMTCWSQWQMKKLQVQLIKITGMCHEGGFNLTKLTRNSKRVLQSIPKKNRRSIVKDKDLVRDLP